MATSNGGESQIICITLLFNGKCVLKPYGFSVTDPVQTFIKLIEHLILDEAERFTCQIEISDQTKVKVFCGKDLDGSSIEVSIISWEKYDIVLPCTIHILCAKIKITFEPTCGLICIALSPSAMLTQPYT